MATVLTIRFYFSSPTDAARFVRLVSAVDVSPLASREWTGFQVDVRGPRERRVELDGAIEVEALCRRALTSTLRPDESAHTRTWLACWRRGDARMEAGRVFATVRAWGDVYGVMFEEDLRLGGNASIDLCPAYPFVADLSGVDAAYNEKVEENLERLTQLIIHLVNQLEPDSVKVFTDQGQYLPFNAHLAYYRTPALVFDDIALIRRVWQAGMPAHRVAPLRTYAGGTQDGALHLWRSPEQRVQVWEEMSAALAHRATVDDVKAVLASQRFDTLTAGDSFFVFDYPYILNAFNDRFFVEVLEHAGHREAT